MTLIFKLNPDVTWHNVPPANGDKLTVADIKATYDLFKKSKFLGLNFKDLTSVEQSSPGFVKFYVRRRLGGHVYNNDAIKFGRTTGIST